MTHVEGQFSGGPPFRFPGQVIPGDRVGSVGLCLSSCVFLIGEQGQLEVLLQSWCKIPPEHYVLARTEVVHISLES